MDVVEELPDDLRKLAADIMDNACLPERFVTNGVDGALRRDIAAALLAERERCAAMTDQQGIEWFERTFGVPLGDKPGAQAVARVRAAIQP